MIALREGFTEINHEHYLSGILCVSRLAFVARRALLTISRTVSPQRGPVEEEERPRPFPAPHLLPLVRSN